MITIKLLGGARQALGESRISLNRYSASVSDLLEDLRVRANKPDLLQRENLIVAINEVDSCALQGDDTLAKDGDTVTILTVVHGGAQRIFDPLQC